VASSDWRMTLFAVCCHFLKIYTGTCAHCVTKSWFWHDNSNKLTLYGLLRYNSKVKITELCGTRVELCTVLPHEAINPLRTKRFLRNAIILCYRIFSSYSMYNFVILNIFITYLWHFLSIGLRRIDKLEHTIFKSPANDNVTLYWLPAATRYSIMIVFCK